MTKIEALKEANKNLTSLLTKLETYIFKENNNIKDEKLIKYNKEIMLDQNNK